MCSSDLVIYTRVAALRLNRANRLDDQKETDYAKHRERIMALKNEASQGMLMGHRVAKLYKDKVVLEIDTQDEGSYKECLTFNELALK